MFKPSVITALDTYDVRFPTSLHLDGSDAMNPDPDYSAAYVVVRTDAEDGLKGHGFAFTIGRGNDVQVAAIRALEPFIAGLPLDETLASLGDVYRRLTHDSQLRWLGPEKGVMHMAVSAVVNALWDLAAKRAGQPLWKLLSDLSPEALVELVDFRYLSDALTPDEALEILRRAQHGRAEREDQLLAAGYPAYTTTPGWLGYSDDKLAPPVPGGGRGRLHADQAQGRRRPGRRRPPPADRPRGLRAGDPHRGRRQPALGRRRRDRTGSVRSRPSIPTGSRSRRARTTCSATPRSGAAWHRSRWPPASTSQNRVIFKQLMQAEAIDIVQIDAARVGGVNENIAILLLAAKFGLPVCPHAGGVGLCELVQHLSMFDYLAVSGAIDGRVIEYVDHLHEHFVDPVVIEAGRYRAPLRPGFSAEMTPETLAAHLFPDGAVWAPQATRA